MHFSLEVLLPESDEIWAVERELLLPTILPLQLLPSQTTKGREFFSLLFFFPSLSVAVFSSIFLRGMWWLSKRTGLRNSETSIHSLLHFFHSSRWLLMQSSVHVALSPAEQAVHQKI